MIRDGDQVLLRLGDPPSPVPAPVADLLARLDQQPDNMNTATNRHSPGCSPAAGPANRWAPTTSLPDPRIGVPTTAGRVSAIRQQVLEMPSPVVADALGYHPVTTARLASQSAAPSAATPPETTPARHRAASQAKESHDSPSLPAALRAAAGGLYALEAATGLIIAHGTWLGREDFGWFIGHGTGTAAIDWEAAIGALDAGELPARPERSGCYDLPPASPTRHPSTSVTPSQASTNATSTS